MGSTRSGGGGLRTASADVPSVALLVGALLLPAAAGAQTAPAAAGPSGGSLQEAPYRVTPHLDAAPEESFVDGLWWSLGVGGGSVRLTCDICISDRDSGVTFHLGLGARARDDLDIGLEAGAWTREERGTRETAKRLDLRAILRPWRDSGFMVIGGIGWVGYEAGAFTYDAAAISAGVGWEFPFAGRWRIGPRVVLDAASWGDFSNDGDIAAEDVSLSIARLEVSLRRR